MQTATRYAQLHEGQHDKTYLTSTRESKIKPMIGVNYNKGEHNKTFLTSTKRTKYILCYL